MKVKILSLLLFALIVSCSSTRQKHAGNEAAAPATPTVALRDTTPKVTGIGGIFFVSDDPKATREWYGKNLGLEINQNGSTFETRNANRPDEINYTQWSVFRKGSTYMEPSKKEFMINYRVQNIEGLVRQMRANGVTIVDTMETYDYGKFIHIMDADGNKIELWEPMDSVLTEIDSKTTK